MIFLDAYALVAWFTAEPAAPDVRTILRSDDAAITTINLAEAVDVAIRVHSLTAERLRADVATLRSTALAVVPTDERVGLAAGELRSAYYNRERCAVSIPDCILVASAGASDRIATADPGVIAVARAEGIDVVSLPDSKGRRLA